MSNEFDIIFFIFLNFKHEGHFYYFNTTFCIDSYEWKDTTETAK